MTKFSLATAMTLLLLSVGAGSSDASAGETIAKDHAPQLPDCKRHEVNTQDCHIHDFETYLHMRLQRPMPGPHARAEFNRFRQKERRKFQD